MCIKSTTSHSKSSMINMVEFFLFFFFIIKKNLGTALRSESRRLLKEDSAGVFFSSSVNSFQSRVTERRKDL